MDKKEESTLCDKAPEKANAEENGEAKKADTDSAGSGDAPTDIVQDSPGKESPTVAVISEVQSPTQTSPTNEEQKIQPVQSPTAVVEAKIETTRDVATKDSSEIPVASSQQEVKAEVLANETVPTEISSKPELPVEKTKPEPIAEKTKDESPVETKVQSPIVEEVKVQSPVKETKVEPLCEEKAKVESPIEEKTKVVCPVEEKAKVESPVEEKVKVESPVEEKAKVESPVEEKAKVESPVEEKAKVESPVEEKAKVESPEKAKVETPVIEAKSQSPVEIKSESPVEEVKSVPLTGAEDKLEPTATVEAKSESPAAEVVSPLAEKSSEAESEQSLTEHANTMPQVVDVPSSEISENVKPENSVIDPPPAETKSPIEESASAPLSVEEPKAETPVEENKDNTEAEPALPVEQSKQDNISEETKSVPVDEVKSESPVIEEKLEQKQEIFVESKPSPVEQPQNEVIENQVNATNGVKENGEQQEETNVTVNGPVEIPTLISWKNGGSQVAVSGDFNKWEDNCVLNEQDGVFSTKVKLSKGVHHLKFLVDGNWTVDESQPIVDLDGHGQVNVLTVQAE